MSIKVLIVDDNPDDVELLVELLERMGKKLDIAVAEDGEGALEYFFGKKKFKPDFVFLDLHLPQISGVDVLRKIRESEDGAGVLVAVLTSSNWEEDRARCFNLKADAFFIKPFGYSAFEELLPEIERLFQLLG